MTTETNSTTDLVAVAEEAEEKAPLEPTWLPNGLPLFVADGKDTVARAIGMGYQVFYILAIHRDQIDVTPKHAQVQKFEDGPSEPRIYKIVSNIVSKAIIEITDDNLGGLQHYEDIAYFMLDPIPHKLIDKMDTFFRRVDEKLGTESIVVLTYDMRFKGTAKPADGWGVVVPSQTNTAGHCHYEPASVLDMIDDEDEEFVRIVGTAHSHPSMPAFASHTDHGDQLGNDGIHITFGWPTNGPTAFWIEMQVGTKTWTLTEEQAFGSRPKLKSSAEIEAWTEKVAKEEDLPKSHGQTGYRYPDTKTQKNTGTGKDGSNSADDWGKLSSAGVDEFSVHWSVKAQHLTIPEDIPKPRECVLFVNLLTPNEADCPICGEFLMDKDRERRICPTCHTFFLMGSEKIADVRRIRGLLNPAGKDPYIKRWNAAVDRGVAVRRIIRFVDATSNDVTSIVEAVSGVLPSKK